MSKYLSVYTDELVKTAGLGQIIAPMAKGLFTKGISNLSNLSKPALTTAAKVEAPAAAKATSFLPNATQQVSGARGIATAPVNQAVSTKPTSFLPNLPEGSTLLNDVHFARTNARQALDLVRQRGTPTARQNAKQTYQDYRGLMDQLSQYKVPTP
jgi:hypothetical protein